MSRHYSKYDLNTYSLTPYFKAHVPKDYPLSHVLQKCRAHRRLPPNLRALSAHAKQWAVNKYGPPGMMGIEEWYDEDGYELDPITRKRLTDKEIDEEWGRAPNHFVVTDIPVPDGGFADPDTWEPEPEEEDDYEEPYEGPTEKGLLRDIASHGREYTAKYYGLSKKRLKRAKNNKELARAILSVVGAPAEAYS